MLFDLLEEQLYLPATLVEPSDRVGRQQKVVRHEHQIPLRFSVKESNASELGRIVFGGIDTCQYNRLIASDSSRLVYQRRIESREIYVPAIHDVDRTGFRNQFI